MVTVTGNERGVTRTPARTRAAKNGKLFGILQEPASISISEIIGVYAILIEIAVPEEVNATLDRDPRVPRGTRKREKERGRRGRGTAS